MRRSLFLAACFVFVSSAAHAQDPYRLYSPIQNLATLFTNLFGPEGLRVDSEATLPGEQPHNAHFNSDFQSNFDKFTTAMVGQLVTVPLPSPASGFTYEVDPTTGVFRRTTQSFGPILAERAETIGTGRVSFGFAAQRYNFQTMEGLDLQQVPAVFTHDNAELLGGRQDLVTTVNTINLSVNQYTTFVTVGVTDRFDISAAIKFVTNDVQVQSTATIQRIGTTNELTHFYRQADGTVGTERIFYAQGRASGLGDITIRMKDMVHKDGPNAVAVGLDLRLPTGDQMNLLGAGTAGVQPFVVFSSTHERLSPHLNASYQWNGSSILAGNPATGESGDFADQATYAAGLDLSVYPRLTVAFDLLGRFFIGAERLRQETFVATNGATFPNITFDHSNFNTLSGSVGFKLNVAERLLIDANLLFALDDHGLRDHVAPLLALEYAF